MYKIHHRWSDGGTDSQGCSAIDDAWMEETFSDGDRGLVADTSSPDGLSREPTDTARHYICKKGKIRNKQTESSNAGEEYICRSYHECLPAWC